MRNNYLLISILFLLLSTSCQKEAETEQEREEMIVGTWGTTVKKGTLTANKSFYWEITFTEDGRYTSIERGDSNVHLKDSVFYEINGSKLYYNWLGTFPNYGPGQLGGFNSNFLTIEKINENKLIISEKYDETYNKTYQEIIFDKK